MEIILCMVLVVWFVVCVCKFVLLIDLLRCMWLLVSDLRLLW